MSRKERGMRAAIKAARLSQFYAHRVGAALFNGPHLIALGYNRHKSHPQNTCFTQHAEFNSLLKKRTLADSTRGPKSRNLTMYVARLTRTDKISLSRPCDKCQRALRDAGIKTVYYTNYKGELEVLKFKTELMLV